MTLYMTVMIWSHMSQSHITYNNVKDFRIITLCNMFVTC